MLDSYNHNMNLKKFSSKFELPSIKTKAPKVINRLMDTTPYSRVNKIKKKIK